MVELPSGTVSFLFTDLEGSTRLWEEHPEAMQAALARHDAILREAIVADNGHLVKTTGDGVHAVFETARDALRAAVRGQRKLYEQDWPLTGPLRVRMGVHTGEAQRRDGDYYGTAANRAARLMAAAHGGQILVSLTTEELLRDARDTGTRFVDLGAHRLRDLSRAEQLFQVVTDDLPCEFPPIQSIDAFPGNLPLQLTSFVGREGEVTALSQALEGSRLVTLTGVGGVGKTRLATQVAAEILPRFDDGAWLCELASATDADTLDQVVAATLGVSQRSASTLEDSIIEFLRNKELLLLLDNCEHLLEPAGSLAEAILRSCVGIRILATSREGLGALGEQVWPLRSLRVPRAGAQEGTTDVGAVRLFIDRARAARPGFDPDGKNLEAVAEVCRRLDGIPLAIELAAARLEAMSAPEIAELLDERFRLLTGGRRTAVERHQTLRAAVDWSYSLLSETEQRIFDRIGVFAGTFDARAASEVASDGETRPWDVREAIGALVAKSLVIAEETPTGVTRFQMLETLRQYAREQLEEHEETDHWRRRHAEFFAFFAQEAGPALLGPDELEWRPRVGEEIDNLRAAVLWGLDASAPADVELALRIIAELAYEGTMRRSAGITTWAEFALPRLDESSPAGLRMAVLGTAAMGASLRGEVETIRALSDEALAEGIAPDCPTPNMAIVAGGLARMYAGDPSNALEWACSWADELKARDSRPFDRANVLTTAAIWAIHVGDIVRAQELGTEALAMSRATDCPSAIAIATHMLAWSTEAVDPRRALHQQEESVALTNMGASDVMMTNALVRIARLRAELGVGGATSALRAAITHSYEDGDPPGTTGALDQATIVLSALDHHEAAATIAGAVLGPLAVLRLTPAPDIAKRDIALEQARTTMGASRFSDAYERGEDFSYEEAVSLALAELDRMIDAGTD
jgi:predicted ATPase/class 3 adenylate cyclase